MLGTLGFLALGLGLGGSALNAIEQKKGANAQAKASEDAAAAQQRAAEANAQLDDFNARVAELQAADAEQRGEIEAGRFAQQVKGLIGQQRTGFAAGNVDVGFGSAVDVQADAAYLGKEDEATIRNNAAREAWGLRVEASNYRQKAAISRQAGQYDLAAGDASASALRTAGTLSAAGTILTAGSSLLLTKYGFAQTKRA
jgi:hypothetical protein